MNVSPKGNMKSLLISMKSLLISIPALLAVAGALASATILIQSPDPSHVLEVSNFFVLGTLALFAVAAALTSVLLIRGPKLPSKSLGVVSLLSLAVLALWFQRHTDLGIFLLGGDAVWIEKATEAEDPKERVTALSMALQGTQYALNNVETIVLEDYADDPSLQRDLFSHLAAIAPNETWELRYRERSQVLTAADADQSEVIP